MCAFHSLYFSLESTGPGLIIAILLSVECVNNRARLGCITDLLILIQCSDVMAKLVLTRNSG